MAVDPVCGMQVDARSAKHRHEYAGQTYVFCCPACRNRFIEEPDMYTGDPGKGTVANRDG